MADKDNSKTYHYDTYLAKTNNANSLKCNETKTCSNASSLMHNPTSKQSIDSSKCCCCTLSSRSATFWASFLTNLGICTLLFGYTLLGSFIFLAIEGGASQMQQRTLASTTRQIKPAQSTNNNIHVNNINNHSKNVSLSPAAMQDVVEVRDRCVENIWDVTVSLNVLYRENWTRLAASEIAKFQDQLIKRLIDDMSSQMETLSPSTGAITVSTHQLTPGVVYDYDWSFARAFLYSLTVLTTIGYGTIAPRTTLGRVVTLAYALFGIPLTLIYLSSTGGVLARLARRVFSRALCCCLCSNCGYCCYDEKRMAEKERKMKKKRQQMEMRVQQLALQEPYYVRSGTLTNNNSKNNIHSPEKHPPTILLPPDIDSLSTSESHTSSMHGLSILAPISLCLCMMIVYIVIGALVLYRLEEWPMMDGIYFCFMALSTIGFGDLMPGLRKDSTATLWFCSIYIMSGMALTAMCFNVLHDEIMHRIKHVVDIKSANSLNHQRTPTSLIYAPETELNVIKDCTISHELIPIVTMNANGVHQHQYHSSTLPEMLDNIPDMTQYENNESVMLSQLDIFQQQQIQPIVTSTSVTLSPPSQVVNIMTGVYTLQEEPEETDDNAI
ncbi:CLUMA_CG011533, isoform A [Clunio marinus]|uniref:CLUMA_CG011533, isoform A n=1 Tax=Clunio marinus TaxID=568069 RepID=A0A1J1ID08_9DIPT|nr:CLUMA_CG011533, isoform A [Clunio marinus]